MIFTEEQVDIAYKSAPEAVKEFLLEGEFASAVTTLVRQEGIEQSQELPILKTARNFLVGLGGEAGLIETLRTLGLPQEKIARITKEITTRIASPEKRAPAYTLKEVVSPASAAQQPPPKFIPTTPVQVSTPAPTPTQVPNPSIPAPMVVPTPIPTPASTPEPPKPAPVQPITSYASDPYREQL